MWVRICLLSDEIQGKARGQYGQTSRCGESAYELRFFFSPSSNMAAWMLCLFSNTRIVGINLLSFSWSWFIRASNAWRSKTYRTNYHYMNIGDVFMLIIIPYQSTQSSPDMSGKELLLNSIKCLAKRSKCPAKLKKTSCTLPYIYLFNVYRVCYSSR